jgi:hypothetical protein
VGVPEDGERGGQVRGLHPRMDEADPGGANITNLAYKCFGCNFLEKNSIHYVSVHTRRVDIIKLFLQGGFLKYILQVFWIKQTIHAGRYWGGLFINYFTIELAYKVHILS